VCRRRNADYRRQVIVRYGIVVDISVSFIVNFIVVEGRLHLPEIDIKGLGRFWEFGRFSRFDRILADRFSGRHRFRLDGFRCKYGFAIGQGLDFFQQFDLRVGFRLEIGFSGERNRIYGFHGNGLFGPVSHERQSVAQMQQQDVFHQYGEQGRKKEAERNKEGECRVSDSHPKRSDEMFTAGNGQKGNPGSSEQHSGTDGPAGNEQQYGRRKDEAGDKKGGKAVSGEKDAARYGKGGTGAGERKNGHQEGYSQQCRKKEKEGPCPYRDDAPVFP